MAGIFSNGDAAQPVEQDGLLHIREATVAHRPDGAGLWVSPDKRVGLVHQRVRVSFVDVKLFRALLSLRKSMASPGKALLATIPRQLLPDAILNRKKTGFAIPFREWASKAIGVPLDHNLRGWARFSIRHFPKIFPLPNWSLRTMCGIAGFCGDLGLDYHLITTAHQWRIPVTANTRGDRSISCSFIWGN